MCNEGHMQHAITITESTSSIYQDLKYLTCIFSLLYLSCKIRIDILLTKVRKTARTGAKVRENARMGAEIARNYAKNARTGAKILFHFTVSL